MKIVVCQRPSSGSQYAKWVRELIPDCRLFLVSEKGSKAAEANEGFCDFVLVDRYYSDEFGKALSSIACSGCDRIICNSEDDVERVAAVRSQYAVPGMKLPLAEGFRDKYSMKSLFSAASLPSTDFALVGSGKDLGAFVEEHGPSVVKPRNGAGAFGVHIVETIDDVDRLLQDRGIREEIDGNMLLVEEYLPGDVYHADVLLQDRIPVFASVSRYIHKPCMFKEENYGSVMLDNASPKRLEIIDLVGRFAKGLPEDGRRPRAAFRIHRRRLGARAMRGGRGEGRRWTHQTINPIRVRLRHLRTVREIGVGASRVGRSQRGRRQEDRMAGQNGREPAPQAIGLGRMAVGPMGFGTAEQSHGCGRLCRRGGRPGRKRAGTGTYARLGGKRCI